VTEAVAKPRRRWRYVLFAAGGGLALFLAALWYTSTASFQNYVRRKVVAEVERITGGHAEIGSFHVVPFHMQVEVRDITVRGRESPNDPPLVHADHLIAHVKVISFLRAEFGFHSLTLDHPVVHVAIAPNGSTNVPGPAVAPPPSEKVPVEQLFALSIDHLSVRNGEFYWGDKKTTLDFAVSDSGLQMDYSYLRGRYESHLRLGKVDTKFDGLRPFSWMTTIDFSLGTTFAEVKSFQLNSGRSHVQGNGRVSDFSNPRLDGKYEAHLDLQEIAGIARRSDLRDGSADLKGTGHWSLDEFTTTGNLAAHDLGFQEDQFVLRRANATSDYSLTDQQLKLSKLQARLFGGSIAGDAQIDNWLRTIPPTPAGKPRKGEENIAVITATRPLPKKGEKPKVSGVQSGVVHLRLRDVSAVEVAAALDVSAHPLGHFHPVGLATGTVDATWRGSLKAAEIALALDVTPPPQPAAGELPVTAKIQAKYRAASDELEISALNVTTPASRIQAAGTLADSSTLHLSVTTSNIGEWQPLVTALGGPTHLPFAVHGSATFNGVAGGTFSSPNLAGTVAVQDFEFTLPATSRTAETQVPWDALTASIQYSSHNLVLHGGTLRRGDTSADFDLNAALQKGEFTTDSPFTAHVNLHKVDVGSTATLAGVDYPISGTADLTLQVTGTRANPQAQGHIHAANASAYGEAIELFDADLDVGGGETTLDNLHLVHEDASITGSASYAPGTRSFQLDLIGNNFDLAQIQQIHLDELSIEGRADFTLKGSGTLDAPEIDAAVHVRDLTLDHELAGGVYLEGVSKGSDLRISGHSELPHGTLFVEGDVQMRGDYPAKITARTDHVDLDALWLSYLGNQLTGHSQVAGSITMQGDLRYPAHWTLTGDATDIAIELEYAKLHNQGPVHFEYAEEKVKIAPTHLVGDDTDLVGEGTISWGGLRELDLKADGQINLKLLSTFDPDLTATGQMTAHVTMGGSLDAPIPQGTIQIKNLAANYVGLPSGVSEMNGSLTFTKDRIQIDQLTAKTGGGTLELKGDVTNYNRQLNFNLSAIGKEVRLRYPPGVSSTANADVRWVGNRSASTISGDVLVTKLAVTPGFDFGSYLERSRQSASITSANSPLYNVKLDVAVRTSPELQMKTAVARLSGDADLRLRGSVARPSVLGRADILEGDATFNGIKFRLERGDITFANPVAIEPQVNLQATTHVRNYDLDITVTGTADRLAVNYRSEPPLPTSDIIALLALGRTSQESEQLQQQGGQSLFTDEATNLIINQAINSTVSSRMQKLFGVSRIKIDPQGLTTETNPTARGPQVTIEQQFANNISLTYSTNVSQSSQQIIQGEYYFNRNVSVVGTRDQNGVVSFDVRIRRRKK
jgi:translocation and assembly module TamB